MEVFDILGAAREGASCVLIKGDSEVVAHLDFEGTEDFPWIYFRFRPLPAWDRLALENNVFYKGTETGLKILELLELRVESIQRLDLWLATVDRNVIVGDFIFLIHEGFAYFRSHQRGEPLVRRQNAH